MRRRLPEPSKKPADASSIPSELQDHDSETWMDVARFNAWCVETLDRKVMMGEYQRTPYYRFNAAVEEWSRRNDYIDDTRTGGSPDWDRLAEIGVLKMRTLKRMELNTVHRNRYGPGDDPWVTKSP